MKKNDNSVIRFTDVLFEYEPKKTILENISFDVVSGEFICIVGPNGGGKTTLLKLILGLIKPTSGKIELFNSTPQKMRSRVGYVPQYANYAKGFPVSVLDVVLMGRMNALSWFGGYSKSEKQLAYEALEKADIVSLADKDFSSLSGGQKQRTLIARAIVSKPDILLLDEPTANVDVHGTELFYELFEELNHQYTILIVSHDIGFVSKKVKSVFCVRNTLRIHPVSELTGDTLKKIFGLGVNLIRHDHRCIRGGQDCNHS